MSDNAAVGAEQDIFGLFGDKKDVHYQVSKTRRDLAVKTSIKGGSLARVDCNIAPSAELLSYGRRLLVVMPAMCCYGCA